MSCDVMDKPFVILVAKDHFSRLKWVGVGLDRKICLPDCMLMRTDAPELKDINYEICKKCKNGDN
jgi:hypothetical protein